MVQYLHKTLAKISDNNQNPISKVKRDKTSSKHYQVGLGYY